MAQNTYLQLKANGSDVQGESSVNTVGDIEVTDMIECLYFRHEVDTAREAGTGMATGRRTYKPIVIRKRIDKASPLLVKALVQNQVIEGKFMFFRPNMAGDGTTEQFYTIEIKEGRISALNQMSPDTFNEATSNNPEVEEVSITFNSIIWTYTNGGLTHEDTWQQQR